MASDALGSKQDCRRVASFAAPSKVNCVDVGRHCLQVFATGNTDRDVSLFSVRSPSPSMTLTGHTSPVESVRFNETEEIVLAGSLGGVIKAFDLTVPRFMCSLRGHAGPVTCLDTCRSQYVASGSMDNYVKLWDLRSDGSCFTYAGHDKTVNSVAFSPDGSWLVSTSSDGTAKIWDLLAGKQLHEFSSTRFGMTTAVFHPHELLLAAANSGGEVAIYDLEYFTDICLVRCGAPVSFLYFDEIKGQTLCALSRSRLSVMSWEPPRILNQVPLDTFYPPVVCPKSVAKFGSVNNPRLILTDVIDNVVAAYALPSDLMQISEISNGNSQPSEIGSTMSEQVIPRIPTAAAPSLSRSSRRSFADADRGQSVDFKLNSKEENLRSGQASMDELPEDFDAIFVPTKSLPRSPPQDRKAGSQKSAQAIHPDPRSIQSLAARLPSGQASTNMHANGATNTLQVATSANYLSPNVSAMGNPLAQSTPVAVQSASVMSADSQTGAATFRKLSSGQRPTSSGLQGPEQKSFNFPPRDTTSPRTRTIATVIPQRPQCTSSTQTSTPKSTPDNSPNFDSTAAPGAGKYDLSSTAFGQFTAPLQNASTELSPPTSTGSYGLSSQYLTTSLGSPKHHQGGSLAEDHVLACVKRDSATVCNAMEQRGKLWANCVQAWRREGIKGAFEYAQMSGNEGFEAEILGALAKHKKFWTLDLVSMVLPRLKQFLARDANSDAGMDGLVTVAIPCLRVILSDFAPVLKSGIRNVGSIGVDVVQDERRQKCAECMRELAEIKHWIGSPSVKRKNNIFLDEIGLLLRTID